MSTKVSIRYIEDEPSGAKAHLYKECLAPQDAPVYLDLTGLTEASVAVDPSGLSLTFAIPWTLARQLGFLPPEQT